VRLWEVETGKLELSLNTGESPWAVAFSPDGKLVAAGELQGALQVWDAGSGELIHTVKAHLLRVFSVAFSPDGKVLASAGEDGRVKLWDVRSGKERAVARPHGDEKVWCVAFLPDGKSLVSGGSDGTVQVHDMIDGKAWVTLTGHGRTAHGVAVSLNGRMLASAGADGLGRIWDLPAPTHDVPSERLKEGKLESLWDDLRGTNGHAIHNAVWTLARSPRDSVPFLRKRVKPAEDFTPPDPDALAKLITNLDDERFAVREHASRELARAGRAAAPHLRRVLEGKPSAELRRRAEELLASLPSAGDGGAWSRELWAVEALEHAGTEEARALLRDLAGGAKDHPLTREAKASLRRLEKASGDKP
jgi:hypothetical protein